MHFENEYAYSLDAIGKQELMKELLNWSENIRYTVWDVGGEHQHYNSDLAVERAMVLAQRIEKI